MRPFETYNGSDLDLCGWAENQPNSSCFSWEIPVSLSGKEFWTKTHLKRQIINATRPQ